MFSDRIIIYSFNFGENSHHKVDSQLNVHRKKITIIDIGVHKLGMGESEPLHKVEYYVILSYIYVV